MIIAENEPAPLFDGFDQDGKVFKLKKLLGKKLIIFFYPKDNTPGCTNQACNLRDNYQLLLKNGFKVIGISPDPVKSHKKFEHKYQLPFPLIADENLEIHNLYGVWGEKKFMGRTYMGTIRTTFLVDKQGIIKKIIRKPDTKNHTDEILAAWNAL